MYIYHFKRQNMLGNKLIPLNKLKDIYPDAYKEHVKKYEGREKVLEKRVPILDCLWNDVLHFSPINPQLILDVYHREDLVPENRKGEVFDVYKIPIQSLPEKLTVCFQSYNFDFDKFDPDLNKFWKFNTDDYKELKEVPEKQIEVWLNDKKAGRGLFWFSHIMHILSKTEVDVTDCEFFQCK